MITTNYSAVPRWSAAMALCAAIGACAAEGDEKHDTALAIHVASDAAVRQYMGVLHDRGCAIDTSLDQFEPVDLPLDRSLLTLRSECRATPAGAAGARVHVVLGADGSVEHVKSLLLVRDPDGRVSFVPMAIREGRVVREDLLVWLDTLAGYLQPQLARAAPEGPQGEANRSCAECVATYVDAVETKIATIDLGDYWPEDLSVEAGEDVPTEAANACADADECPTSGCVASLGGDDCRRAGVDVDELECPEDATTLEECQTVGRAADQCMPIDAEEVVFRCCAEEGDCLEEFRTEEVQALEGDPEFFTPAPVGPDPGDVDPGDVDPGDVDPGDVGPGEVGPVNDEGNSCSPGATEQCEELGDDRCGAGTATGRLMCSSYNAASNCPAGEDYCWQVSECGCGEGDEDASSDEDTSAGEAPETGPPDPTCVDSGDAVASAYQELEGDGVESGACSEYVEVRQGVCTYVELHNTCDDGSSLQHCHASGIGWTRCPASASAGS